MRSQLAILILTLLAASTLSNAFAYHDDSLSAEWQDVAAGQKPVSKNFAQPMKAGRKWDTKTPKLENPVDKAKRRNKRVSKAFEWSDCS